ncbi:voltage-dependent calcium channel gamma-3 subunit-like [Lampetra fluviatilis]
MGSVGPCERGVRGTLTTVGAFTAFSLMTIAVGTDYWLYARGTCRSRPHDDNETAARRAEEVRTHSGLWRTCCLEGSNVGVCRKIDHFPEENDYDNKDMAEYLLRMMRSSSAFPILSVTLLLCGGLCVAGSEFYRSKHNLILGAGISFVAAGLANIIGIIVYISSNSGDPGKGDPKKSSYSYGWSFYFGALSFIVAETIGVLIVHTYVDTLRQARSASRPAFLAKRAAALARLPSHRFRQRRRSSASSAASALALPPFAAPKLPAGISLYTLTGDAAAAAAVPPHETTGSGGGGGGGVGGSFDCERDATGAVFGSGSCFPLELKESLFGTAGNRRTTPV